MADVFFTDFFLASGYLDILLIVLLMSEVIESRTDSILLTHFEVLPEVLVTTPPWQV